MAEDVGSIDPGARSAGYRSRTAVLFAAAEIVGKLASFAMFAVATRLLGPDGFGEFSWAMGLGLMVASFGMFGFDMALIQLGGTAPQKTANYLTASITLRLVIGAVGLGVLAALPLPQGSRSVLLLMTVALSLENISSGVRAAAGVLDRQRGAAVNIIVQRVAIAAISIAVLVAGGGVLGMAASYLAGTAIGTLTMLYLAHRIGATPHPRNLTWADTRALTVKAVLPGVANTMNMQTVRIDVVALARGSNYTNVGYFSSAYKLMETSLFLSESLIRAAMPAMLYAKQPAELWRIIRAMLSTASVLYFPLAVTMALSGGELLGLVFGEEYDLGGRTTMIALGWALLAWVTIGALTEALLTSRHSGDVAMASGITMVFKLVIVWPLVDRFGSLGAGLAVATAFTVQAGLLWWRLRKHAGPSQFGASLIPAAFASLVMAPIQMTGVALLPSLFASGLLYLIVWIISAHVIDPASVERVRSLVRR